MCYINTQIVSLQYSGNNHFDILLYVWGDPLYDDIRTIEQLCSSIIMYMDKYTYR